MWAPEDGCAVVAARLVCMCGDVVSRVFSLDVQMLIIRCLLVGFADAEDKVYLLEFDYNMAEAERIRKTMLPLLRTRYSSLPRLQHGSITTFGQPCCCCYALGTQSYLFTHAMFKTCIYRIQQR